MARSYAVVKESFHWEACVLSVSHIFTPGTWVSCQYLIDIWHLRSSWRQQGSVSEQCQQFCVLHTKIVMSSILCSFCFLIIPALPENYPLDASVTYHYLYASWLLIFCMPLRYMQCYSKWVSWSPCTLGTQLFLHLTHTNRSNRDYCDFSTQNLRQLLCQASKCLGQLF